MRFVDVIVEQQNFHVEITVYLIWPLILLWIQVAEMSFFRRVAGLFFRDKVPVLIFKYKGNVQNCISYKGIQLRSPTVMLWERLAEARLRREVRARTDVIFTLGNTFAVSLSNLRDCFVS